MNALNTGATNQFILGQPLMANQLQAQGVLGGVQNLAIPGTQNQIANSSGGVNAKAILKEIAQRDPAALQRAIDKAAAGGQA
mmetsp:Transcript_13930/g.19010  ORF Transcript_13930/g.19010 Transcript_13930/m.19010 type:complete len:82 (+) Transcript_13930:234-479(+)|eukprot:CAMPEP_0185590016 /NCGR_PEP_ID=MMETSP0434-20130131/59138_1 /TAXON_ID=626734 ORGANISM="Favella taraikaensis, Strain Fe Narragansett Bay" /NCGR_SAMPLE_ID=MMETSP0434 /ASSEMBLY_ACC=CAM_ASM_000379 /LENGTH=81 /DNA_ID=CAMNT_0028213853 /DNA_START=231 /DNA_END=476 /DNA_ORIENTATION=-